MGVRHLIVNADDFGLSPGVNRGILKAHEYGIVTSTSLMVCGSAAAPAAAAAREYPGLSLGLHLDLGEWVIRDGEWVPSRTLVPLDDADAVQREIVAQYEVFRSLVNRDPTHLDSHQHVHLDEPLRSVAIALAREIGIPLRHCTPSIRYCGGFYGQGSEGEPWPEFVSVDNLLMLCAALGDGTSELCCHPGYANGLVTMYARERELELATLCDPRLRAALVDLGIGLRSFTELHGVAPSSPSRY